MRLSFERHLVKYCQGLAGMSTTSLKQFFCALVTDCPRLLEPLLLLALAQGREGYVMRMAAGTKCGAAWESFLSAYKKSGKDIEQFLDSLEAPDRYRKVYQGYRAATQRLARDRETMARLVAASNELVEKKQISRYRLVKELGINKGNLYAFLKGDTSKMSRRTAIGLYRYLKGA